LLIGGFQRCGTRGSDASGGQYDLPGHRSEMPFGIPAIVGTDVAVFNLRSTLRPAAALRGFAGCGVADDLDPDWCDKASLLS